MSDLSINTGNDPTAPFAGQTDYVSPLSVNGVSAVNPVTGDDYTVKIINSPVIPASGGGVDIIQQTQTAPIIVTPQSNAGLASAPVVNNLATWLKGMGIDASNVAGLNLSQVPADLQQAFNEFKLNAAQDVSNAIYPRYTWLWLLLIAFFVWYLNKK